MNVQDYRSKGFAVSTQIEQAAIDRAEADVKAAYLDRIGARTEDNKGEYDDALMQLAFTLVLQRSIVATRAGAKEKATAQSVSADRYNVQVQQQGVCQFRLSALAAKCGVQKPWRLVTDICKIYWKSFYKGM